MSRLPRYKKIGLAEIECKLINDYQSTEIAFKFADGRRSSFKKHEEYRGKIIHSEPQVERIRLGEKV